MYGRYNLSKDVVKTDVCVCFLKGKKKHFFPLFFLFSQSQILTLEVLSLKTNLIRTVFR